MLALDLFPMTIELADIAIVGMYEYAVAPIALADFLERLLPLHSVKLARETVAFAAFVAIPQLGGGIVVDHARDIDGKRVQRFHAVALGTLGRTCARGRRLARGRFGLVRGAREQLG